MAAETWAYAVGSLVSARGPRTAPFLLRRALAVVGLLLALAVRDTAAIVALEHSARPPGPPAPLTDALKARTYGDRRLSAINAAGLANNLTATYASPGVLLPDRRTPRVQSRPGRGHRAGRVRDPGLGTALVYPTLLAAVADVVSPRPPGWSVGVCRFWRDLGYVAGALVAGITADLIGLRAAVLAVAAITTSLVSACTVPCQPERPPERRC